jgi:hypothetical protein
MIKLHSKQTPWINFQEWTDVRNLLLPYSNTETKRIRRGLERVSTWSCRGRVPLSVQSTAQLLRIKLSDNFNPALEPDVLRLSYSMSIVRLVNGIVEPAQKTKAYASSVADTAEMLGLPRWFVDVRHDSTHTTLPSLDTLRMAADTALMWLTSHYWDMQSKHLASEPERIKNLLTEFESRVKHQQQQNKRKRYDVHVCHDGSESGNKKKSMKRQQSITSHDVKVHNIDSITNVRNNKNNLIREVTQHISHQVSPSSIRNVVINFLVHSSYGCLLVRKRFNENALNAIKFMWIPLLDSMQQAWPFFYGALLTTIVENISFCVSEKLSLSARKSDAEKSLRWWANDILVSVLLKDTQQKNPESLTSFTSPSFATASNNISLRSQSRRVAPIDRNRLLESIGVTDAIDIYGHLLPLIISLTRTEDLASATRNINNNDAYTGSTRAVQLLQLDSEIRALTKKSGHLVTNIADRSASPQPTQRAQLMSLEELESSIHDDEDCMEETKKQENKTIEGNEWSLCTSWSSCPIGIVKNHN